MMNKEEAEKFLFKVDMEGLDYAVENYAPENTGDKKFDKLITACLDAQEKLKEYLEEIRGKYDIDYA